MARQDRPSTERNGAGGLDPGAGSWLREVRAGTALAKGGLYPGWAGARDVCPPAAAGDEPQRAIRKVCAGAHETPILFGSGSGGKRKAVSTVDRSTAESRRLGIQRAHGIQGGPRESTGDLGGGGRPRRRGRLIRSERQGRGMVQRRIRRPSRQVVQRLRSLPVSLRHRSTALSRTGGGSGGGMRSWARQRRRFSLR